ncbi:hypothetical protein ACOMHN_044188 [Nucella lapillus]
MASSTLATAEAPTHDKESDLSSLSEDDAEKCFLCGEDFQPQVGHEDLDAAVCLLERLAAGGISAEEAANHDVISKINKRLEEHKETAGHHNYAKSARLYLQQMMALKDTHPKVYQDYQEGHHVFRRSERY